MSDKQQYRILDVLGQGQLGTVCLVERLGPPTERLALKLFNPQVSGVEDAMERLLDSLPLLAWTRHPAVLRPQGLVRLDGQWGLTMEAVEGCDLRRLLMAGPMPAGPAMELVALIAGALHAVYYQAGPDGEPLRLLHGDIKPANSLLTPWGEARLLDFGVLRALEGPDPASTLDLAEETRTAPEQFEGVLSPAADIYALGCTLYEMLCGHPCPAAGRDAAEHRRVLTRILRGLEQAEADPLASTLVEAMLAWEGEARPIARDVEKLARELRRSVPGPSLREWAHDAVDHALEVSSPGRDARVGTVLTGTLASLGSSGRGGGRRGDKDGLPGPSPSRSSRVGALRDPDDEETITRTMPGARSAPARLIDPDATEMMSPLELAANLEPVEETGEVERTDAVVARLSVPSDAASVGAPITDVLSERDVDPLPRNAVHVPVRAPAPAGIVPPAALLPPVVHPPQPAHLSAAAAPQGAPVPAAPVTRTGPPAPIFRGAANHGAAAPSAAVPPVVVPPAVVPPVAGPSHPALPGFVPDPPLPPRVRLSAPATELPPPAEAPRDPPPALAPPMPVSPSTPVSAAVVPPVQDVPPAPPQVPELAPAPEDPPASVEGRPVRDVIIMAMPAGCVLLAVLAIVAVYAWLHLK